MSPAAYLKSSTTPVAQFCAKVAYTSRQEARKVMNRMGKVTTDQPVESGLGVMNVYRCGSCSGWHIGHWGK